MDREEAFWVQRHKAEGGAWELRVYRVAIGIWAKTLKSLAEDPNGSQTNLRTELIQYLGQRVSMLTDYQLPITPDSERLLYAVEVHDVAKVKAAAEKIMGNEVRGKRAKRLALGSHSVWEMIETKKPVAKPPKGTSFLDEEGDDAEDEASGSIRAWLPHAAITVVEDPAVKTPTGVPGGYLMLASHLDFLAKVLQPRAARDALSKADLEYLMVDDAIARLGITAPCARFFSRTDKEYYVNYEMTRLGMMPQSQSMLGRMLNQTIVAKEGEARKQQVPNKNMPPYDMVRRALGPAGAVMTSEPTGWFLKGFDLKKP